MVKNISVSIIQTNIVWENKEMNLKILSKKIAKVKDISDLVVLPEMFNTGFSLKPEKNFETIDGNTIKWLKKQAIERKIAIAGSLIIKENNNFFNRFVFVYPNGEIKFYDKRHLFRMANEHNFYTPGNKRVIIDYMGWKIILQVCYDLRFPVWSRNIDNEYDLMIYVANWPKPRISQWETLLAARAIENQAYVIGVNRIGIDGNSLSYIGASKILNPKGENLVQIDTKRETIETTELSYSTLLTYREKFPVVFDTDSFEIKK